MYFKDIIGQEEIKKRLIHSAQTGVVPHAQLFTEQGGAGAFPLTLAYARYLNCTNRTETDSCGHCPSCLKYNELAHPDLHFVFPIVSKKDKKKDVCDDYLTEWRGFLKDRPYFDIDGWLDYIDAGNSQALIYSKESDEIIRKLSLKIYEATYRILLVWLPEKLHPTCANKLLKIIEEPPRNTVILMVSELPDLVLGTILSRAQRINVRGIHPEDIAASMISRFNLTPEDAKHVAHLANGSYLKAVEAISLGEENKFYLEQFKGMMRNSWARNVRGMKDMADVLASIGRERQKNFLSYCQHLIRENFMYRFQSPELNKTVIPDKLSQFFILPVSFPEIEESGQDHQIVDMLRCPADRHIRMHPDTDPQCIENIDKDTCHINQQCRLRISRSRHTEKEDKGRNRN